MNNNAIERIAAAVNVLRPEWPTAQTVTLIRTKLDSRPAQDVAVALAFIACDPASKSPYRVIESGPWWRIGSLGDRPEERRWIPPKPHEACPHHLGEWANRCRCCEADRKAGDQPPASVTRTGAPPDPDLRATMRAAVQQARNPTDPGNPPGFSHPKEEA